MKKNFFIPVIIFGLLYLPQQAFSQEESAEISMEEVEDEFQQNFYEALKHKAIENYDKAIDFLLECKRIDPANAAVDFELGKNYLLLKDYMNAETYLLSAVSKDTDNIWLQDVVFSLYVGQKNYMEALKAAKKLADRDSKYKMYLVTVYVETSEYKKAMSVLEEMNNEFGRSTLRDSLAGRLTEVIEDTSKNKQGFESGNDPVTKMNPVDIINDEIESLISKSDFNKLLSIADEALENYPAQASFYYAKGLALNKLGKHDEAIEILLMSIDYLIDDPELENNIYKELVLAYQATGNNEKTKEYQKMIKKGL